MSDLRSLDRQLLSQLFKGPPPGGVLHLTAADCRRLVNEECEVDLFAAAYAEDGEECIDRLNCLLRYSSNADALNLIKALWQLREYARTFEQRPEEVPSAQERLADLIRRLSEGRTASGSAIDFAAIDQLRLEFGSLADLEAQARGYAFEKFLKGAFDAYGLEGRASFRLVGEQIDGSFQLGGETYLMEAKWHAALTGAQDLHSFHGKVEQKASWARGVFISHGGFSPDGLVAFGRGKRVFCVDSTDIQEMFKRGLSLKSVLEWKVRMAAENGLPFNSVTDWQRY